MEETMEKKYPDSLVKEAHFLAFSGEIPNKDIAKYLRLTKNELNYVLYTLEPKEKPKPKERTITESFLDFFILEEYK